MANIGTKWGRLVSFTEGSFVHESCFVDQVANFSVTRDNLVSWACIFEYDNN